jgi:hypothetical protein
MDAAAIAAQGVPAGGNPQTKVSIEQMGAGTPQAQVQTQQVTLPQANQQVQVPVQTNNPLVINTPNPAHNAQSGDATAAVLKTLVDQVGVLTNAHKQTEAQVARQNIFNAVTGNTTGTEEDFNNFSVWAANNLPAEQVTTLNTVLKSGDPNIQSALVAGYAAQYRAATSDPANNMLTGNTNIVPQQDASQGYMSEAAFRAVMLTEKYKTDPQFAAAQDDLRRRSRAIEEKSRRGF